MKIAIGSYEAKTKLPELLRQVKAGKSFTITDRGEAIADLVPSTGLRTKDTVDVETRPYGVTGDIPACVSRDVISLPQQFSIYPFSVSDMPLSRDGRGASVPVYGQELYLMPSTDAVSAPPSIRRGRCRTARRRRERGPESIERKPPESGLGQHGSSSRRSPHAH